jgi:hypothetical protein
MKLIPDPKVVKQIEDDPFVRYCRANNVQVLSLVPLVPLVPAKPQAKPRKKTRA